MRVWCLWAPPLHATPHLLTGQCSLLSVTTKLWMTTALYSQGLNKTHLLHLPLVWVKTEVAGRSKLKSFLMCYGSSQRELSFNLNFWRNKTVLSKSMRSTRLLKLSIYRRISTNQGKCKNSHISWTFRVSSHRHSLRANINHNNNLLHSKTP